MGTRAATLASAVDVFEDSHRVTVFADLPGVPKKQLEIKAHDGTFHRNRSGGAAPSELQLQHAEIREPHFFRAFMLSADIDASRIDAQLRDGVLRLTIPRRDEARPRRIEVATGGRVVGITTRKRRMVGRAAHDRRQSLSCMKTQRGNKVASRLGRFPRPLRFGAVMGKMREIDHEHRTQALESI